MVPLGVPLHRIGEARSTLHPDAFHQAVGPRTVTSPVGASRSVIVSAPMQGGVDVVAEDAGDTPDVAALLRAALPQEAWALSRGECALEIMTA